MSTQVLHGLLLPIPEEWRPDHLYRFRLPAPPPPALRGPQRSAAEPELNLVVGAYPKGKYVTPEALLAELNRVRQARDPWFVVLSTRSGRVSDQLALVQDSSSGTPGGGLSYQREIVVPRGESLTMMVVTAARLKLLDDACSSFLELGQEVEVQVPRSAAAVSRRTTTR
ncbi:MAG: hypothetical protein IPG45_19415 [Deltaproteobacteria bacterium]|nr:hypothetical protein [Deltaproteobacteria bacterium]